MTVATELSRAEFLGSGSAGPFTFNFRFFAASEITVTRVAADGTETVLDEGTEYTLTGAGSVNGGVVTLAALLLFGEKLLVTRKVKALQPASIRNLGAFYPEIHEDAFDRLTMMAQDRDRQISDNTEEINGLKPRMTAAESALGVHGGRLDAAEADLDALESAIAGALEDGISIDPRHPAYGGNLALADAAAVAAGKRLLIASEWIIPVAATLNAAVKIVPGGSIRVDGALNINGPFEAGLYQVFSGAGSVLGLGKAFPHWFGGAPGAVDVSGGWQRAINSLNRAGKLRAPAGAYGFLSTVELRNAITIEGDSNSALTPDWDTDKGTVIYAAEGFVGDAVLKTPLDSRYTGVILKNFRILSYYRAANGIWLSGTRRCAIENVYVAQHTGPGIYLTKDGPAGEDTTLFNVTSLQANSAADIATITGSIHLDHNDSRLFACRGTTDASNRGTSGNRVGLFVASTNNYIFGFVADFNERGIYVRYTGVALVGCRADSNTMEGYYWASTVYGGTATACQALGNSKGSNGVYDAFSVNGSMVTVSTCFVDGAYGAGYPGIHRYAYYNGGAYNSDNSFSHNTYTALNRAYATAPFGDNSEQGGFTIAPKSISTSGVGVTPTMDVNGITAVVIADVSTPTAITNLTGGFNGQELKIVSTSVTPNFTVETGGNIFLSHKWKPAVFGETLTLSCHSGNWYELSHSKQQSTWDNPLRAGTYSMWFDSNGLLRTKNGTPASETETSPYSKKVPTPASYTTAGLPGQWASSDNWFYTYTGDGTTHKWQTMALNTLGGSVASAGTITPTGPKFHITGTTQVDTINVPIAGMTWEITIIADGAVPFSASGNIATAFTAVAGYAYKLVYDGTKWYPSH